MKKTKRYEEGGGIDVETMKQGIAAGSPAEDDGMRPGKNLAFEPDRVVKPRRKVVKPAPKAEESSLDNMDIASRVMRRGQAGESDSGTNPSLERLKGNREADAARKKRKMDFAMERVKAGLGYKKGGSVGSASKRADGCAQRGKTKGRVI